MRMEDIPGIQMDWINDSRHCEYFIYRGISCTEDRGIKCSCVVNGFQTSYSLRADYGYKV